MRNRSLFGIIVAIVIIAVSTLIALALEKRHVDAPYLVLLLGTIAAAIVAGPSASILAIALSAVIIWFFFIPPVWSFSPPSAGDTITILLFLVVAFVSTWLYYRQRKTINELNAANVTLRQQLLRIGRPQTDA